MLPKYIDNKTITLTCPLNMLDVEMRKLMSSLVVTAIEVGCSTKYLDVQSTMQK